MSAPKPRGVYLVTDGVKIPIDDRLHFLRRTPDGTNEWQVDLDEWDWTAVTRGKASVTVDHLPPHTALAIGVRG